MAEVSLGRVTVPILYSDDDIVAVNKPAGLPVLTASGKMEGTLSEVVLAGGLTLYEGHGVELAGVVHRLDKDTSGVMLLARTEAGWNSFKRQLNEHEARKEYLAIVRGSSVKRVAKLISPLVLFMHEAFYFDKLTVRAEIPGHPLK